MTVKCPAGLEKCIYSDCSHWHGGFRYGCHYHEKLKVKRRNIRTVTECYDGREAI